MLPDMKVARLAHLRPTSGLCHKDIRVPRRAAAVPCGKFTEHGQLVDYRSLLIS